MSTNANEQSRNLPLSPQPLGEMTVLPGKAKVPSLRWCSFQRSFWRISHRSFWITFPRNPSKSASRTGRDGNANFHHLHVDDAGQHGQSHRIPNHATAYHGHYQHYGPRIRPDYADRKHSRLVWVFFAAFAIAVLLALSITLTLSGMGDLLLDIFKGIAIFAGGF